MDRVVIDTLNIFLRISEVLPIQEVLLIQDLRIADCIGKNQKFQKGFDRTKYTHMATYGQFVKSLGIPFQCKVCPNSNTLEFRDMTGPEKYTSIITFKL